MLYLDVLAIPVGHFTFCFAPFKQKGQSELQESAPRADTNPVLLTAWKYTEKIYRVNCYRHITPCRGPEVAGQPASHNLVLVSAARHAKVLCPAAPKDSGRAGGCQMGWQVHAIATNKKEAAQKWVSGCIWCSEAAINLCPLSTEQWERLTAQINVGINTEGMHTHADGYLNIMFYILITKCHLFSWTTNYTHLVKTFS